MSTGLLIVLTILATYRVSFILSREDGPYDVFHKLRNKLLHTKGLETWGEGLTCFACNSVWVGMFFATLVAGNFKEWIVLAFAISGVAVIMRFATTKFFGV